MLDWAIIVLPVIMAVVVCFAPAPEAGKRFGPRWRWAIFALGVVTALLAVQQEKSNAREKQELRQALEKLRTVSPLRKEAADLAKELFDFYNSRERYNERFKLGQALSDTEARAVLKWYSETVRLYHVNYERRITSVLEEIHAATGMDVASLEADAKRVGYAPEIGQTATRLSAFAVTLP